MLGCKALMQNHAYLIQKTYQCSHGIYLILVPHQVCQVGADQLKAGLPEQRPNCLQHLKKRCALSFKLFKTSSISEVQSAIFHLPVRQVQFVVFKNLQVIITSNKMKEKSCCCLLITNMK